MSLVYIQYIDFNIYNLKILIIESTQRYRPRPGIVLDDTLDYTTAQGLPSQRPYASSRHPSLGDVFDVTVSAIHRPGGSTGDSSINRLFYFSHLDMLSLIKFLAILFLCTFLIYIYVKNFIFY